MKVDLSGLRALVTGSTKGIGRAIAHALAKNGAEVAINGRKPADVEQAIAAIRATLPTARLVPAPGDAATAQGVAAIIKAAGDVDILVNNVGIFEIKNAFDIPDEDWQRLFATNVLSGVRFTRHYGSRMRDKGFGRIVFISSESGVQIPTEMIHYGFTKSADLALMRGFAQALAVTGAPSTPCCRGRPAPKASKRCSSPWAGRSTIRRSSVPSSTAPGRARSSSGWPGPRRSPRWSPSCAHARRAR